MTAFSARALISISSACLLALTSALSAVHAQAPAVPLARSASANERMTFAEQAWAAGDYVRSLTALGTVLRGDDASQFRERVALMTGENWRTSLVAENARAPRWSPDGKRAAFETGTGASRVTRVVDVADGFPVNAEIAGSNAVFSPDGARIAYLAGQGADARVMLRRLSDGRESAVAMPGLVPAQLAFAQDGALLVVAAPTDSVRTRVYRVPDSGAPMQLSRTDSVVSDVQVARSGSHLVYGVGGRSPVQIGTGRGFAGGPPRRHFAVLDLATGVETVLEGEAAVLSASGNALAFITRANGSNRVHHLSLGAMNSELGRGAGNSGANGVGRSGADSAALYSTSNPLTGLAITPDGSRITWQEMPREDWELYTAPATGGEPERVTREIQHDLMPQWLDNDRLLAVMGEARHRRSYLYTGGRRIRLFHNNTVRTIAPEYEWAPSPDGTKLLIVAERDGDTVTPHRYLWCMDLTQEVSVSDLLARIDDNLVHERRLRASGERAFAPILADVRRAVNDVSTDRVYGYAFDLFQFDSKHISQPGNAKAQQYLEDTYRSFGYRDVRRQAFDARPAVNQPAISTANVLAVLPGTTHPELVYVISSHFDSRAQGPGADDNTSGTSVLLEAARVLASRPQAATIIFASLTGEESGLLGSREFVRQAKASNMQLAGVLNNDMVGWANDQRLDNTIRYSNPGIRDIQHAAAIQFSNLITYDAFYYKSTDAQAFYDGYGDVVGGIGSYPVLGNPHYHQVHDVLETINHQLVAEVAKTTVASIMYLASSPSRLTGLTARATNAGSTDVSWQAGPEKDIAKYIVRWGPESEPERYRQETPVPRAQLSNAPAGTVVSVKAVNRKGLEGWDWAVQRVVAP